MAEAVGVRQVCKKDTLSELNKTGVHTGSARTDFASEVRASNGRSVADCVGSTTGNGRGRAGIATCAGGQNICETPKRGWQQLGSSCDHSKSAGSIPLRPSSRSLCGILTEVLTEHGIPAPALTATRLLRDNGLEDAAQSLHLQLALCMEEARNRVRMATDHQKLWDGLTDRIHATANGGSAGSLVLAGWPSRERAAEADPNLHPSAEWRLRGHGAEDRRCVGVGLDREPLERSSVVSVEAQKDVDSGILDLSQGGTINVAQYRLCLISSPYTQGSCAGTGCRHGSVESRIRVFHWLRAWLFANYSRCERAGH